MNLMKTLTLKNLKLNRKRTIVTIVGIILAFTTSLRSNEVVLEKLLKVENIKQYPEDTELLEDVIIENKQAIEMTNIIILFVLFLSCR